jgi:hypothetical protein
VSRRLGESATLAFFDIVPDGANGPPQSRISGLIAATYSFDKMVAAFTETDVLAAPPEKAAAG